jgi:uncharacterized membrane protein
MAFMYAAAGVLHFIIPSFYEALMSPKIPCHSLVNAIGGISEIILAILLLIEKTRVLAARLIIGMLIVFLLAIHIPMAFSFYELGHPGFWIALIRIPLQFVLIWWAWLYTKPLKS